MLFYTILFTSIGFVVALLTPKEKYENAYFSFIVIGIMHSVNSGIFWGFVSFIEMMIGSFIVFYFIKKVDFNA